MKETKKTGKKGVKFLPAPMVIASGVIDRGHLSSFGPPPDSSSSFFSEDLVPTEVSKKEEDKG